MVGEEVKVIGVGVMVGSATKGKTISSKITS
jgi:hypothetical protein